MGIAMIFSVFSITSIKLFKSLLRTFGTHTKFLRKHFLIRTKWRDNYNYEIFIKSISPEFSERGRKIEKFQEFFWRFYELLPIYIWMKFQFSGWGGEQLQRFGFP